MAPSGPSIAIARGQAHTFLTLWATLSPYTRTDRTLPNRLDRQIRLHRQFGSRDRKLYRELVYTALRYLPWLEDGLKTGSEEAVAALVWLANDSIATRFVKSVWCESWPQLTPLRTSEKVEVLALHAPTLPLDRPLLPEWFRAECSNAFTSPLLDVLHTRSPLWLRVQTDDVESLGAEFHSRGWTWQLSALQPDAWRMDGERDVMDTDSFRNGRFEVQDLGSQLILGGVEIARGSRWLDACAGAGGKTLQLARRVGPHGRVTARDIRAEALDELRHRADRSRMRNISIGNETQREFDGVLVDAPCSGTGTWRRSPHLKSCTQPADIAHYARVQAVLLDQAAQSVRPGGQLVYATCSLCRSENQEVVQRFLASHPGFTPQAPCANLGYSRNSAEVGESIDPAVHDTDGFYVACLQRES